MPRIRAQTAPGGRRPLLAALCLLLAAPGAAADSPLTIGVFEVGPDSVVDGDTLRLLDGGPTLRILALDTEEVFKSAEDRAAAMADFPAYARARRGDSPVPVKYGTPAGEAARDHVRALLAGVKRVRLERDDPNAPETGIYGRRLGHVVLLKAKGEVNLAEAVIRAGHSPYFTKYGRSLRFHDAFRRAEREAMAKRRGIWGTRGPAHYPDYPERRRWWQAREAQVERWRADADAPDHVTLGARDADERMQRLLGKPCVVFGLFDRELPLERTDRRILLLGHRPRRGLPLVFFSSAVLERLEMHAVQTRFVTVRGKLTAYRGRPQIVVTDAAQISTR
jgi:micrococcal nuclease